MIQNSLEQWRQAGSELNYQGHRVFTKQGGPVAAEALLLIHGFPTSSWDWAEIWPDLCARYRVYTLDMMGFGFSAKPRDYHYSIMAQASLCEAFLAANGVNTYHILAHDYGDSVAQELLARHIAGESAAQLQSIAFLNGGLFPETHRPVLTQKLLLSPLGFLVAKLTSRATLAANMRKIFGPHSQPSEDLIDAFWTQILECGGAKIMHKLIGYMRDRHEHRARWVAALQDSTIPLKLIDGVLDPISGEHMVARYEAIVPNADITRLASVGHYPQIEAPVQVLAAYLAFRAKVATNTSP